MRALAIVVLGTIGHGVASAERSETLRSYWNDERTAILSEVAVHRDDGSVERREVLGGSVDGVGMIQIASYARTPAMPALTAFVPEVSKGNKRLRWAGSCVFITPDSGGSSDVDGDGEMAAISAAVESWNRASGECGYLRLIMQAPEPREVGLDGKNVIKFREDRWCRPNRCGPDDRYDPSANAITTLFFVDEPGKPDDGILLDTDIEMNSVHYALAVGCETMCLTASSLPTVEDTENTLTHELGHVLGMGHTCWDSNSQKVPDLDDQGRPQPSCRPPELLSAAIRDATMYNFQSSMEIKKRTPEADDVSGVCSTYPIASDPHLCEPVMVDPSSGCCSVAGAATRRARDGTAWLAGGLLGALALVGFGRARARACSRNRRR